jgi:hypothetical protein
VESGGGVVGEDWVCSARECEVVFEVADCVGEVHGFELVAHGDSLVEGCEGAHAELAGEGWLSHEDACEW